MSCNCQKRFGRILPVSPVSPARSWAKRLPTRLVLALLFSGVLAEEGAVMAEDTIREPNLSFINSLQEMGLGLVLTEAAAIAVAEVIVGHYHGEAEFQAQRPLRVIGEGVTADGTRYWWVEGAKTELSDRDFLGLPMRVRLAIGKVDGRVLDIHFHHPDMIAPPLSGRPPPLSEPVDGSPAPEDQ